MKLLVCGIKAQGVEAVQLAGFRMHRRALRRLGISWSRVDCPTAGDVRKAVLDSDADVAMLMLDWNQPVRQAADELAPLREQTHGRVRLVLLDHYAQTSTPMFDLLPLVDRYAKRQVLRDVELYRTEMHGGYIFTDYLSRVCNLDLDGWHFGSILPQDQQHKLVHAWNLAVQPTYHRLLRLNRLWPKPWHKRRFDVNARLGLANATRPREWYEQYRAMARQAATRLGEHCSITPNERVGRRKYFLELRDSRIVFSPFGWGEICYRDHEAVVSGALLLKPDMSHLRTSPDIFSAHQTYVPVKWDLSDLQQQVDHYLSHPEQAKAIARAAQDQLWNYFQQQRFIDDLQRVIGGNASAPADEQAATASQ